MALGGTGNAWGDAVTAVVNLTGLNASEQTQVKDFWRAVCGVHVTHITGNSLVQTTSGSPDSEHQGVIQ